MIKKLLVLFLVAGYLTNAIADDSELDITTSDESIQVDSPDDSTSDDFAIGSEDSGDL